MATIGLTTSVPPSETAEAMALADNVRVHGRFVDQVEANGPAAEAGLQPGDVLLQLGDNDLYSADDVADFLAVSSPGDRIPVAFKRSGDVQARQTTVTLGELRKTEAPGSGLRWTFAGLGQLPKALETARAKKKKVMVGLSGAETWWPSTRFESGALSKTLNDPKVVRASVDFVRVIVRRPHAYFFIEDLFEDRGGIRSATPAGCRLADGSTAPLPGLYFLDADGGHLRSVALQGADAQAVLEAMGAATAR